MAFDFMNTQKCCLNTNTLSPDGGAVWGGSALFKGRPLPKEIHHGVCFEVK